MSQSDYDCFMEGVEEILKSQLEVEHQSAMPEVLTFAQARDYKPYTAVDARQHIIDVATHLQQRFNFPFDIPILAGNWTITFLDVGSGHVAAYIEDVVC